MSIAELKEEIAMLKRTKRAYKSILAHKRALTKERNRLSKQVSNIAKKALI